MFCELALPLLEFPALELLHAHHCCPDGGVPQAFAVPPEDAAEDEELELEPPEEGQGFILEPPLELLLLLELLPLLAFGAEDDPELIGQEQHCEDTEDPPLELLDVELLDDCTEELLLLLSLESLPEPQGSELLLLLLDGGGVAVDGGEDVLGGDAVEGVGEPPQPAITGFGTL